MMRLQFWFAALSFCAVAARPALADEPAYVPLPKGSVTFNKDIAPIVYANCSNCHRPNEVAPFTLQSYADVKKHARLIARVTADRSMPPWKADEGAEKFHDARRLSAQQIGLIQQWADDGAPEGKAADAPPSPKFEDGWQAGPPDAVFEPSESYTLAAEGDDIYRCFVVKSNFAEDRWVSAMEVRPGNRLVVHHVIVYLDTNGQARKKDEADAGPGYTSFGGPGFPPAGTLGGWAPGNFPRRLPQGVGIKLPKGADVVLQVHYHRSGKEEVDRSKIGVYFCDAPVDKELHVLPLAQLALNIPPGEKNYEAKVSFPVPLDVTVLHVVPHMHLLGRDMTVTTTLPDGTTKKLVNVPDWDFNWQTTYAFKDPVKISAGSKVSLVAHYDNSTDNPRNPNNPPRLTKWGEETTDEMCIAFFGFTRDDEHLAK